MRVLHAFKDYFPPIQGGIEQHVSQVVHNMAGIDFTVLTSSRSKRFVVDDDRGVEVIRTPEYFRPVSTPITPAWARILRDPRYDLAHFHMPNPFGELARLASRSKTPYVASFHAEIIGRRLILPLFGPLLRQFLSGACRILVSSSRLFETAALLRPHRKKAEVIPYGIRADDWAQRPAQADIIREQHRSPLVLYLGRLAYYKGLDVLIDSMQSVEATCLIAGDGSRRGELELRSQQLGLGNKIVFCGEVSDVERLALYHAADVFVLPSTSRAECFGLSMLEAMACGTPPISTELGTGTSWVNQDGVTGLVVEPGNPRALAGALTGMLGDPVRRSEMGEAASARAREHFSLENMLSGLESVYRSV